MWMVAYNHCRPRHPNVADLRRNDDVAAAKERRVAGKTVPRHNTHQRDKPGKTPKRSEARHCQPSPNAARSLGVAWSAPAALAEPDDGESHPRSDLDNAIRFVVAVGALGPGQHGRVVRQYRGAGFARELVAVDAANPGDDSIRRGRIDQVFE